MNNGVFNYIPGLRKLWNKKRTPLIYEIIDVERRILFLLCLQHANDLPYLPLELVMNIAKRITCEMHKCSMCSGHFLKGLQFATLYHFVYCSKACMDHWYKHILPLEQMKNE